MNANNRLVVKLIHCGNINIVNPRDRAQKNMFFMPMGLFPLAGVLRDNGFDIEILHLDLHMGETLEEILDIDAVDIVGFDCHWVNQSIALLDTAEAIKKLKPGVFIVLGGFTASLFAEEILYSYPQVDAVIRGDGEIPLLELCCAIRVRFPLGSMEFLGKIRNLAWKDTGGNVIMNDISYVAAPGDMEELDFAAVDLLRNWESYQYLSRFYSSFTPIGTTPMFLLETGRGCQYACAFCGGNRKAQERMNNRTRTVFRSVESVLETIKKAIGYGFKTFYSCMESEESQEWYIRLFKRIKEERLEINYGYGGWKLPSESLIDAMSEACQQVVIEISPETSSHELRKKNKDNRLFCTNRQLEECLRYISNKDNLKVQLFFGYYLSSDTRETILNTIDYIIRLLMKFPHLLEIEYANFSTDPGSLYFFFPEKYSINMKVRKFRDYIECLRENYIERMGQPADMTVFKSAYITDEEDEIIHRNVSLFNYLFSWYRKSVTYILEKTGNTDIIMEFIAEADIFLNWDNTFSPDEIKDRLLEQVQRKNAIDPYLSGLITFECEMSKSENRVSKPTTQLALDSEREENLVGIEDDDRKAFFTIEFDI